VYVAVCVCWSVLQCMLPRTCDNATIAAVFVCVPVRMIYIQIYNIGCHCVQNDTTASANRRKTESACV